MLGSSPPLISIIIPVWNMWALTRQCLESLAANCPRNICEVVVVDNGSSDATATELAPLGKSLFGGRFKRVVFSHNKGFAPACNEGARHAQAPFLLFLNNDTIALPGFLPPLLEAFSNRPMLGAAGPLLLYENAQRVQHLGISFSYGGVQHLYAYFPANHPLVHKARNLQALTAAALLLPAQFFLEAGTFYEGYHNGFEDLELCVNLRRKGYSLECVTQSRIIHLESQTPGRNSHDSPNALAFTSRCGHDVVYDLHSLVTQDGLSLRLNPQLKSYPALEIKAELTLNRMHAQETRIDSLLALLEQEPLWQDGYRKACAALDVTGCAEQSLELNLVLCNLFPLAEHYAAAQKRAEALQLQELAENLRSLGAACLPDCEQRNTLVLRARDCARKARQQGNTSLEQLYRQWVHHNPALPKA